MLNLHNHLHSCYLSASRTSLGTSSVENKEFRSLLQSSNYFMQFLVSAAVVVVIMECEGEALALLFARGKWVTHSYSLLRAGCNNSNSMALWGDCALWGDYSYDEVVATGLLHCIMCLLHPRVSYNKQVMP